MMKQIPLCSMLSSLPDPLPDQDTLISGLSCNSNRIKKGDLFVAFPGTISDGREYISQAIQNGAQAVVAEKKDSEHFSYPKDILITFVEDLQHKMGFLASYFYGDPSKGMEVIGITGTNGKTTSGLLLYRALKHLNVPCGLIGTLGVAFNEEWLPGELTTPDAISIQKNLAYFKSKGAKVVAMEVSSHGLMQHRLNGVNFSSAIFTNLTRDHLDYHGTMEDYGKAKQKLFTWTTLKRAIINYNSEFSHTLLDIISQDLPIGLYGQGALSDKLLSRPNVTLVQGDPPVLKGRKMQSQLKTTWGEGVLSTELIGQFNLHNLMAVLSELSLQGFSLEELLPILAKLKAAPGRMQRLGGGRLPLVLIDYAHTPDALHQALTAARQYCRRTLWCVFGCGGGRDEGKRSLMGEIASNLADKVILTNDNPRNEAPKKIIEDIMEGIPLEHAQKIIIQKDRESAIQLALTRALALDVILIAGKGHENYQLEGTESIAFSDSACVNKIFSEGQHEAV
ncbi:MAG TPA: UDP-N-acetylmuramoyl-L-alanyl-D-glutamate--2,6-diaminopimelate ligase [Gammaproteobacteria bacterium]|nr:UDP-N-acetylmuramoyl-L-alanyl-D-glutamate--2,6-diaminopimelate ligase [Gammaproteobacteria bacterium]